MPSGKYVSSIGKKYGKLLVLDEIHSNREIRCLCRCDCGNEISIVKHTVTSGKKTNCGCQNSIIGKNYGLLTILEELNERTNKGGKKYLCECKCGNKKVISLASLHTGTKSCGCLNHQKKYDGIINKKFGSLTVLKELDSTTDGCRQYLCRCECGNEKVYYGNNLISGNSTSCGCKKGYVENTKICMIKMKEAYPNSKSGIKGVWQDKNGYWHAIITVCGKRILYYGGAGDVGKNKCVNWRDEMVEKYHKPLIEKYSDL